MAVADLRAELTYSIRRDIYTDPVTLCKHSVFMCVSCCLAREHTGHRVELLSEASEKKKEKLRKLEIKKDELSRKIRHIEELCNMADPLTLIQERESHAFCGAEGADNEEATDLLLDINTTEN
ncbi:hypothetical protein XELAEV_18014482mg [Xenopus laevis]|uniref:Uncharacterized protein n=1 Tax=Xenopus laevis TaxID=8355 RepID=A0A974HVB8_XENLA|nr:hypothetical protein XELAEV_18014482mg [Xenopus laevis]